MSGPLSAVDDQLAGQAVPAVIEAVSNAMRHSGAGRLTIEIDVGDKLTIDIIDDGCGIDPGDQTLQRVGEL